MTRLLDRIEDALQSEVQERCRDIIKQRDAFELELAKRFIQEGRDFVKGPYRATHPGEVIPSNAALHAAKELLEEKKEATE